MAGEKGRFYLRRKKGVIEPNTTENQRNRTPDHISFPKLLLLYSWCCEVQCSYTDVTQLLPHWCYSTSANKLVVLRAKPVEWFALDPDRSGLKAQIVQPYTWAGHIRVVQVSGLVPLPMLWGPLCCRMNKHGSAFQRSYLPQESP